jgi:hypothetical protein
MLCSDTLRSRTPVLERAEERLGDRGSNQGDRIVARTRVQTVSNGVVGAIEDDEGDDLARGKLSRRTLVGYDFEA